MRKGRIINIQAKSESKNTLLLIVLENCMNARHIKIYFKTIISIDYDFNEYSYKLAYVDHHSNPYWDF
jgi:hypothetical protein